MRLGQRPRQAVSHLFGQHVRVFGVRCPIPQRLQNGQQVADRDLFTQQVVEDLDHLADTHSTSIFLAVEEVLHTRRPPAGSKILLLGFGSGLTVGGTIYHGALTPR